MVQFLRNSIDQRTIAERTRKFEPHYCIYPDLLCSLNVNFESVINKLFFHLNL